MKRKNHRKPGHQLLVMILCAVLVFSSVPVYAFSPERSAEAVSDRVCLPAVEADAADAAEQESVSEDAFSGGLTDILFGEPAAGEALAEEAAGEASAEEAAAGEASQEETVEEKGQPGTAGGQDGY